MSSKNVVKKCRQKMSSKNVVKKCRQNISVEKPCQNIVKILVKNRNLVINSNVLSKIEILVKYVSFPNI